MERQQVPWRVQAKRASAGGPPSSLNWCQDRSSWASAPPARRPRPRPLAWAAAPRAASAWGAESRKPGTGLPTQTTQRRGGNSFIALSCSRPPPPLSAEVSFSSGRQQQGSGRGRGAWRCRSAQSATRGRPLPDRDGGARTVREGACACVSRRRMRVPLCQATATKPRLLPSLDLTRPPLPSDSAAQKANGEGASFTVHINLVFVGYALAAANAFRKGSSSQPVWRLSTPPPALPTLAQGPRRAELWKGAWVWGFATKMKLQSVRKLGLACSKPLGDRRLRTQLKTPKVQTHPKVRSNSSAFDRKTRETQASPPLIHI